MASEEAVKGVGEAGGMCQNMCSLNDGVDFKTNMVTLKIKMNVFPIPVLICSFKCTFKDTETL